MKPLAISSIEQLRTRAGRGGLPLAIVLTAIPVELRAVLRHVQGAKRFQSGGIVFQCGIFHGSEPWCVAAAVTGPGNLNAMQVVSQLRTQFDDIDALIFTGIAGSIKADVGLCDIVVARKIYWYHGASAEADANHSRPEVAEPDFGLIQAATHTSVSPDWWTRVEGIKSSDYDVLPARNSQPEVHVKPTASGEEVIKSVLSTTARMLKQDYGDSCAVEMEGYGILAAADRQRIPALVVRGISDNCNDKTVHDAAGIQAIAAAHAAAFTFQILHDVGSQAMPPLPTRPAEDVKDYVEAPSESGAAVSHTITITIKIDGELRNVQLQEMQEILRKVIGDPNLVVEDISEGSILLQVRVANDKGTEFLNQVELGKVPAVGGHRVLGAVATDEYQILRNAKATLRRASSALLNWPTKLTGDVWIPRRELDQLLHKIDSESSSSTIVLGEPGSGKSALLSMLGEKLLSRAAVAILAIKADFLPTTISDQRSLSQWLGLSDDVVATLKQVSAIDQVVVLIDQLDALASLVDLKSERLNVLLNMIRAISGIRNIHIVASSRLFEFQHDTRLTVIEADHIALELPSWDKVAEILHQKGLQTETWPEPVRAMLVMPQSLNVFLELLRGSQETEIVTSYQAMLDQLWRRRITSRGSPPGCSQTLNRLALEMAEEETLWLPSARFDENEDCLDYLVAGGFLTRSGDGLQIAFAHQTMFEHALARSFTKTKGELATYVLARQDSLFIRPKLLAALRYLRATDLGSYERELSSLWSAPNLREHLRQLLIEFLGQQQDPSDIEESWVSPFLKKDIYRARLLRAMASSKGWFERLARSHLPIFMDGTDTQCREVVPVLQSAMQYAIDRAFQLISRYWSDRSDRDKFTWWCLSENANWKEEHIQAVCKLLSRTEIDSFQVARLAGQVSIPLPKMAPKLIAAALNRYLETLIDGDANKDKLEKLLLNATAWWDVPEIAESAPIAYIETLWPWYLRVFQKLIQPRTGRHGHFLQDHSLATDIGRQDRGDREDAPLMLALEKAIERFATDHTDQFIDWYQGQRTNELMVVQRLLALGIRRIASEHPALALNFLLGDQRRLALGSIEDTHSDTKALIKILASVLEKDQLRKLEDAVLQYEYFKLNADDSPADRLETSKYNRIHRLKLLRAIPKEKLTDHTRRLVEQEERAFPNTPDWEMKIAETTYIGSPMSRQEMEKATDNHILQLLRELNDSVGWDHPRDWMRGGNIQLSREFSEFAKVHPDRAIKLMRQLKPTVEERAVAYAIEAISETDILTSAYFDLVSEFSKRGFGSEDFRHHAASGVGKRAVEGTGLPDKICELLESWLDKAPKLPDRLKRSMREADQDKKAEEDSSIRGILWGMGGISILPHGNYPILETLSRAYLMRRPIACEPLLQMLDKHVEVDEDPAVWGALLKYIPYASSCDRDLFSGFLRKLLDKYPDVIASPEGVIFLAKVQRKIDSQLMQTWLKRVRMSDWLLSLQAYGELLALHAITNADSEWAVSEVDSILEAEEPNVRESLLIGLAHSAANLWSTVEYREKATSLLVRLMEGAQGVRAKAIMDLFRHIDELLPDDFARQLFSGLLKNQKLLEDGDVSFLTEHLQSMLPNEEEYVFRIAKAITDISGSRLAQPEIVTGSSAGVLVNIAITLHRMKGKSRVRGLELFESLMRIDSYDAKATLDQLDGRLVAGRATLPRRIRKRQPRG